MDSGSLDAAVQAALQALYPPFEATAPTVLGQVFRLLETSFQGDGLCCLLQFLIPAKRLFEHIRQAACAPYLNCIFLHEGWPLCLHEKVVVHLAPLNPLLLRPGDFYLQAEPCAERCARITLKHLSRDLRRVEETPLPAASYPLLFTKQWLQQINSGQHRAPLHSCLVASQNGVTPLPWSRIATPEFIDKPEAEDDGKLEGKQRGPAPGTGAEPAAASMTMPRAVVDISVPYGNVTGTVPGCKATCGKSSQGRYPGLIKVEQAGLRKKPATLAVPSLYEIISQNLEGEYVDLLELSQEQLGLLARSLPPTRPAGATGARAEVKLPWVNGAHCTGAPSSEEGPCPPCQGRQQSQEPGAHAARCRQRDSYLAALQNPVSFSPGLMAAILEEPDGPGPEPPPSTPTETPAQRGAGAGSPTLLGHRAQRAGAGVPAEAPARHGSSRLPTGSSHKFSFLKGPRLGAAPGVERASSQHEGAWRKMSAIYSPRMGRAKPAGKGSDAAASTLAEEGSLASPSCRNGPLVPSSQKPPAWQELHPELLCSGIVCLPGSSDRLGRALLQVNTSSSAWGAPWCSATELARLILYLCSLPRQEARDTGLAVLVDARKHPPAPVLFAALRSAQSVWPGCIHTVLLLAEKELVSHRGKLPGVQVETLASLKALGRFVDSSQLTQELDGAFPYCHGEWVQFFQKLHPFVASLRQALELLHSCIQELGSTARLAGRQDVARGIERHEELMRRVLSEPRLARLQREGGAVLAKLRRELGRLGAPAHGRTSMELAEGLYSQLEEQLHLLVSQSNQCLQRLELLQRVQQLETEFHQLGCWLDGEAVTRLQEMGTEEESPQGSAGHFSEFLSQATARYQHGLALCQEAAEVPAVAFPEAHPFQEAAALLRTKLLSFSRQLERRQLEQELLHELSCFSSKVAGLQLERGQRPARRQRGEGRGLRGLQGSLQTPSLEPVLQRLQEMRAQVRSMRSSRGLAAWSQARHRYQESRQLLQEMLAQLQEAWGLQTQGQADAFSPPGSEASVCKEAKAAVSEGQGAAEQLETSTGRAGEPQESSIPSPVLGEEPSSPEQALEEDQTSHQHLPAATSVPKPKSRACLGAAGHVSQEHSQPFSLPPRAPFLGAVPLCPSSVPLGTAPAPAPHHLPVEKQAEATQYFQVSSQSSFSSEESDSHNPTEEAPAASLALPWDLQSPSPPCPSEKLPQIVYLEKQHSTSPERANAK